MAGERFRFRRVDAQSEVERPLWRRKPVRLFVGPRTFTLEVQVERSVGVIPEWHPTADRKPIEGVGNLEAFGVIKCDGPEGVRGWRVALVEMQRVLVCTVEWFPRIVRQIDRVYCILLGSR